MPAICLAAGCGGPLKFVATFAAPGSGQAWVCEKCGDPHTKFGSMFVLTSDDRTHHEPPPDPEPPAGYDSFWDEIYTTLDRNGGEG